MKNVVTTIAIAILATVFIIGCGDTKESSSIPSIVPVVSLVEKLPFLEREAKSWQTDAYLAWAEIPIRLGHSEKKPELIAAEFYSPSMEFESLGVELTADGSITSELVEYEASIFHRDPIALADWEIDSQEALDIMLDDEGLDFLQSTDS